MSRSPSEFGLWLLRDALCLRAEARGMAIDAPARYHNVAAGIDAMLDAVDTLLPEARGKAVSVRLGHPWVWHVPVPWQTRLVSGEDWLGWTRATCDTLGIEHDACHIALGHARYGKPRLAAIADTGLIEALQKRAARHDVRLRSVTSTFAHAMHRYGRMLPAAASAIAIHEHGTLYYALRQEAAVVAMTTLAGTTHDLTVVEIGLANLALGSGNQIPASLALISETDPHAMSATPTRIHWIGPHLPAMKAHP